MLASTDGLTVVAGLSPLVQWWLAPATRPEGAEQPPGRCGASPPRDRPRLTHHATDSAAASRSGGPAAALGRRGTVGEARWPVGLSGRPNQVQTKRETRRGLDGRGQSARGH